MDALDCLCFYSIGVVVASLIMLYDLRKTQDIGYVFMSENMKRVAMLSLWSWVFVFSRFAVWLIDFVVFWCVWIVFKYKVWRNDSNGKSRAS